MRLFNYLPRLEFGSRGAGGSIAAIAVREELCLADLPGHVKRSFASLVDRRRGAPSISLSQQLSVAKGLSFLNNFRRSRDAGRTDSGAGALLDTVTSTNIIVVGGLLFAGLAMATVPRHIQSIEADIGRRTEAELAREDLAARVRISGRDIVLSGQMTSDARRNAIRLVSDLWGVGQVADEIQVVETASAAADLNVEAVPSSATLRVKIDLSADGRVTLDGQAPSDAAKEQWLAAALVSFPDDEISDRLEVGEGGRSEEADALSAAVVTGLSQLSRLEEGSLDVTPARLRIVGRATDSSTEVAIAEQLAADIPRAIRFSIDVHASGASKPVAAAVHLTLARNRDGSVVVSGVVPDGKAKRNWLAKAAAAHPAMQVKDRLRVEAFDAPEAYGDCALAALPWVGKLVNGRFDIGLKEARVFGKAKSRDDADRMRNELAAAGCVLDIAHLKMPRGES